MKPRLILWLAFVFLAGGQLGAQVLTYSVTVPQTSTSWTRTLQLPAFDASVGTLTGVLLTLSGGTVQTVRAENNDASHSATYNLETKVAFSGGRSGNSASLVATPTTVHLSGSLGTWDGALDYAGASGVSSTQNLATMATSNDANLASYIGTGSLDFFAVATLTRSIWSINGSASSILGSPTTAGAVLQIEYTYSAIPEPGEYAAVMGLLVLMLTVLRGRTMGRGLDWFHSSTG